MVVMEGDFIKENLYSTTVRCGVPGNEDSSQILYEILVDTITWEVTETRVLTDDAVNTYNLNDL